MTKTLTNARWRWVGNVAWNLMPRKVISNYNMGLHSCLKGMHKYFSVLLGSYFLFKLQRDCIVALRGVHNVIEFPSFPNHLQWCSTFFIMFIWFIIHCTSLRRVFAILGETEYYNPQKVSWDDADPSGCEWYYMKWFILGEVVFTSAYKLRADLTHTTSYIYTI